MLIVHVPFCFYPDPVGGTEVYVAGLARELASLGVDNLVVAPGQHDASYEHDGLTVRRYAISQKVQDLRDLYGEGDPHAARALGRIFDEVCPDVVHMHALTDGVSLRVVREAQQRRIPVVFTYHTPTVSCTRGTLMRWGRDVCDGTLDRPTCAACTLHGLGVGRVRGSVLGALPPAFGRLVGRAGCSGGVWTALRMSELVELRHSAFSALMDSVDHVVVLCQWVEELLRRNGVPAEKMTVCRHGICQEATSAKATLPRLNGTLRVAFFGRIHFTKGIDVLVRAVRSMPDLPVKLDVYGVSELQDPGSYAAKVTRLAGQDRRIRYLPPVANDEVVSVLRDYHVLAVPSRWLETGPLVVLEAFAAGVPVIGSNLGGIAEWVEHGVNGILLEAESADAWCQTFQQLIESPRMLYQLRDGVRPPRSVATVAAEMLKVYENVLECRKSAVLGV